MSANKRTSGEKRTRKRDVALAALLTAPSIAEAAGKCGVAESTLRRWLAEPAFGAEFRKASSIVLDGAVARLQAGLLEAAETLRRNLACDRPSVQVASARSMFEITSTQTQIAALAAQLQDIERRLEGSRVGGR